MSGNEKNVFFGVLIHTQTVITFPDSEVLCMYVLYVLYVLYVPPEEKDTVAVAKTSDS